MSYGGIVVDLSEEEMLSVLERVEDRGLRVFESPKGIIAEFVERWVREEEQEYIHPLSPAPEGCIRSGPPAPGVERIYFPRLPLAEYTTPANDGLLMAPGKLEALVNNMRHSTRQARRNFLRDRRAVVKIEEGGKVEKVIIVPSHIQRREVGEPLYTEELDPMTQSLLDDYDRELPDRRYKKTYLLHEVLDNPEIATHYGFSARAISSLRRNLDGNERIAAALLQDMLNRRQQHTYVEILLDKPGRDRVRAEATIRDFSKGYREQCAALDSAVVDDTLYMFSWEGAPDWHVRGPLKYAETIQRLFWIANVEGPYRIAMMFAMEMVALDIHVSDGLLASWDEFPYQYHAAQVERETSITAEVLDPVNELPCGDNVCSVSTVGGRDLGSALRLNDSYVLVNSHLIDSAEVITLDGIEADPEVQLSPDLVLAKCLGSDGGDAPGVLPQFRSPSLGEEVRIHYRKGRSIRSTNKLKIKAVHEFTFDMQLDDSVSYGISGGSVISLDDGHVLGLHSGMNSDSLVACSIGSPRVYDRMMETLQCPSSSSTTDEDSHAKAVVHALKSTGRTQIYQALVASIAPCPSGFAVCDGDKWLQPATTGVDISRGNYLDVGDIYRTVALRGADTGQFPVATRAPHLYELVHILWKDSSGVRISRFLRVEEILTRYFLVSSFPGADLLSGALIFAKDGSALGVVFGRAACTCVGLAIVACPYPTRVVKVPTDFVVKGIRHLFPQIDFREWPPGIVEEVVTHSSRGYYDSGAIFNAGQRPLANVGDDVAKTGLYKKLRREGIPYSKWSTEWQRRQSNAAMSRVCWSIGLGPLLRTGDGVLFPRESKAYADMLEAFVGAVSIFSPSVLEEILSLCELI